MKDRGVLKLKGGGGGGGGGANLHKNPKVMGKVMVKVMGR